jgi:hypothetical protein
MSSALQLTVEFVEHEVGQQLRKPHRLPRLFAASGGHFYSFSARLSDSQQTAYQDLIVDLMSVHNETSG